ncbi:hypothetical protein SAMN05877753_11038 [Bacillus oleivorans]|uniref:Uncharacterized protein n=1 Tax=Bacillus oleivorans TaxID=1448271 RepID=A0A285D624_9BACI|nr:hypothetical protein [Bacillus oleivorans]SNX74718.1 hypothetical protein SAMN05877753_11038 [Bacillus oleivorans]
MLGTTIIVFTGLLLYNFIKPPVPSTSQTKKPTLNKLYSLTEGSVNTAEAKING